MAQVAQVAQVAPAADAPKAAGASWVLDQTYSASLDPNEMAKQPAMI